MEVAKIFETGRSQAVLLAPKEAAWDVFLEGLSSFTDDFYEGGREQAVQQERESL